MRTQHPQGFQGLGFLVICNLVLIPILMSGCSNNTVDCTVPSNAGQPDCVAQQQQNYQQPIPGGQGIQPTQYAHIGIADNGQVYCQRQDDTGAWLWYHYMLNSGNDSRPYVYHTTNYVNTSRPSSYGGGFSGVSRSVGSGFSLPSGGSWSMASSTPKIAATTPLEAKVDKDGKPEADPKDIVTEGQADKEQKDAEAVDKGTAVANEPPVEEGKDKPTEDKAVDAQSTPPEPAPTETPAPEPAPEPAPAPESTPAPAPDPPSDPPSDPGRSSE